MKYVSQRVCENVTAWLKTSLSECGGYCECLLPCDKCRVLGLSVYTTYTATDSAEHPIHLTWPHYRPDHVVCVYLCLHLDHVPGSVQGTHGSTKGGVLCTETRGKRWEHLSEGRVGGSKGVSRLFSDTANSITIINNTACRKNVDQSWGWSKDISPCHGRKSTTLLAVMTTARNWIRVVTRNPTSSANDGGTSNLK